jgi:thioredoxin 1
MPTTSPVTETTDDRFAVDVLEAHRPVLVDFWAPWCAPCRVLSPVIEQLASERDDVAFAKVDIDVQQRTAAQYEVLAAPTLILFRSGQPVLRLVGTRSKRRLEQELAEVL